MSSAPASSYPLHNMTNIPVELLLIPLCLTALVSTEIDNYVPDLGTKHSSVQYSVFKSPAAPWHAKDFSRSPVIRRFSMYQEFRRLTGVVIMAENPWDEVFVKEPAGGGCRSKASSTVRDTAALHGCHLAVSAGFFNTSDGAVKETLPQELTLPASSSDFIPTAPTRLYRCPCARGNIVQLSVSLSCPLSRSPPLPWQSNGLALAPETGEQRNARVAGYTVIHSRAPYQVASHQMPMTKRWKTRTHSDAAGVVHSQVDENATDHRGKSTRIINNRILNAVLDFRFRHCSQNRHSCIGNVVTNSSVIQTSSNLNAHFGLLRTGEMFMGYPNVSCIDDFKELVVGALWIVRDGKPNWEHSAQMEEVSVQQTGSWKDFMAVVSARASIGWDKRGRIILAAVDGKTGKDGTNIPGIARVMMHFGAVEAINLDGGGSMTVVADGMVFNAPSDAKPDENDEPWIYMTAERLVTSIMCFKRR
ncbi:unnamed protein product [Notodromas monacha]|uniref:Phosphodiester glycosidase domain-containing protein n=1 Tax=Notodromas monacha TaxID=399045 RepID=A0A7R9BW35_9CRUS|nr:unnamed protein product [Notodromas monacha]CAG0922871.1 unnamed protein product [Notodromas monacha]